MKQDIVIEKIGNGFIITGHAGKLYSATEEGVAGTIADQLVSQIKKRDEYPVTIHFDVQVKSHE